MAVNYAKTHAGSHSRCRCGITRKAIQAGGITLGHTYHAKDYGPMLRSAGFTPLLVPMKCRARGDVIIIQPYAGGNPRVTWRYMMAQRVVFRILNNAMWPACHQGSRQPSYTTSAGEELMKIVPFVVALILLSFCSCSAPHHFYCARRP